MQQEITLLPVAEVCRRVGLSRPSIYRMMAAGKFPKPTYPAKRAPRWRSDEIQEFIDGISDARRVEPAAA